MGRSRHERARQQPRCSLPPQFPLGGDRAGVVPPCGGRVGAQPPRYCLPGQTLLFIIIIVIVFSCGSGARGYLVCVSLAPRLCGAPQLRALRGACLPQSMQDGKLADGFPVILGNFGWIRAARYSPCSAAAFPTPCSSSASYPQLCGHEPTSEMSWSVSAHCLTTRAAAGQRSFLFSWLAG